MKLRYVVVLLVLVVLLTASFKVSAQETAPMSPDAAGDLIGGSLETIIGSYAVLVGGLVTIIVSAAKYIPALKDTPAQKIQVIVTLILVIIVLAAQRLGYGTQITSAIDAMTIIGATALKFVLAFAGSTAIHEASSAKEIMFLGYKRSA